MIPVTQATILRLPAELAARVGAPAVLAEEHEDGYLLAVYRSWEAVEGGYDAEDAIGTLTPAEMAEIGDLVRCQRGPAYHEVRHADGPRDAARPVSAGQRWAGMKGRARRSA